MHPVHPVVFLLGLHGSGKTSTGRMLEVQHGYTHISLGDLGRLARNRRTLSDYPLRLMCLLAGHTHDRPFRKELVTELLSNIQEKRIKTPVSVDGFPSEPWHLEHLPEGAILAHLVVSESIREQRLSDRSLSGPRKWTPGQRSIRDDTLSHVISAGGPRIHTIDASTSLRAVVQQITLLL